MEHTVIILFVLAFWIPALFFLVLTLVYRKYKTLPWFFGILTVVLGLAPKIIFSLENQLQRNSFVGMYYNEKKADEYFQLNKDQTWQTNVSFLDCKTGQWSYWMMDGSHIFELENDCLNQGTHQVYSLDQTRLTFRQTGRKEMNFVRQKQVD